MLGQCRGLGGVASGAGSPGATLRAGLTPILTRAFPRFAVSRPHSLFPIAPLGPTMKLKRLTVLDKYKDIIDSFYQEQKK